MKGGIYDQPECCFSPCECPVCLENKLLKRLNCNHYICQDDINQILSNRNPAMRVCPICRQRITSYGCGNEITNVSNQPERRYINVISDDEESDEENIINQNEDVQNINRNINIVSDDEDDYYGGKKQRKHQKKHKKTYKNKKSIKKGKRKNNKNKSKKVKNSKTKRVKRK
jgi:hypothetical protein